MSRSSARRNGHRHRWVSFLQLLSVEVDTDHAGGETARLHHDFVADLDGAACDGSRVAAVVVVRVRLRAHDVLHGEAHIDQVLVGADVDVLEVVEQRGALVPRHVLGAVDDVVALER